MNSYNHEKFSRTAMMISEDAIAKLANSRVAVFGIGGVGGYAVEALVRSGLGYIDIIDKDEVDVTNINRQIIATEKTVGMKKVKVMSDRIHEINPQAKVTEHNCFFLPETSAQFDFAQYDYVIDAVDTVTAKIELVMMAKAAGVPIISSMGAGNKLDPTAFQVEDIYKTSVCPLAKVMRKELRARGVESLKVVYSTEEPINHKDREKAKDNTKKEEGDRFKGSAPGSIAFVPPVVGLIMAGEVIKDLVDL